MDPYPLFEDGSESPTSLGWIFVDSVPTDQEDTIEECEFEFVEYQLQTKHVPIYKLDVSQKSVLARIASTSHDLFLRRKPKTRTDYLNGMTYLERMLFEKAVLFRNPDSCLQILTHKQKSHRWLWSRQGRITGSVSGSCVGQNPYCRVLKSAWESVYQVKYKDEDDKKQEEAPKWGEDHETQAAQDYLNDLNKHVQNKYSEAKREEKSHFQFRSVSFTTTREPVVEIRCFNLMIDFENHWRGMSPDGIVFVNGVPVGIIEIKCPYSLQKDTKYYIYPVIKSYYYNQLQSNMYIAHKYFRFPTTPWCDFIVWTPQAFTVEHFEFDADYFLHWYLPRELRFYFEIYLPCLAERMYLIHHLTQTPIDKVIEKVLFFPQEKK